MYMLRPESCWQDYGRSVLGLLVELLSYSPILTD
jgi:hypothetical protein